MENRKEELHLALTIISKMNLLCYRINFYFVVSKVRGVRASLRTHSLFSSPVQSKVGHPHRDQGIHKIILSCRSGSKRLTSHSECLGLQLIDVATCAINLLRDQLLFCCFDG